MQKQFNVKITANEAPRGVEGESEKEKEEDCRESHKVRGTDRETKSPDDDDVSAALYKPDQYF